MLSLEDKNKFLTLSKVTNLEFMKYLELES